MLFKPLEQRIVAIAIAVILSSLFMMLWVVMNDA